MVYLKDTNGSGCPFCRGEIKGTESVVVDPFDENKKENEENAENDYNLNNKSDNNIDEIINLYEESSDITEEETDNDAKECKKTLRSASDDIKKNSEDEELLLRRFNGIMKKNTDDQLDGKRSSLMDRKDKKSRSMKEGKDVSACRSSLRIGASNTVRFVILTSIFAFGNN